MSVPDKDVEWLLQHVEEDADICSEINGEQDEATLEARRIETTVKRLVRGNAHVATLIAQARAEALEEAAADLDDLAAEFERRSHLFKIEDYEKGAEEYSGRARLLRGRAAAIRARKDTQ